MNCAFSREAQSRCPKVQQSIKVTTPDQQYPTTDQLKSKGKFQEWAAFR
jgi:hypothetical protein